MAKRDVKNYSFAAIKFDWQKSKFSDFVERMKAHILSIKGNSLGIVAKSQFFVGIGMYDIIHWRRDLTTNKVVDSELKILFMVTLLSDQEQILINALASTEIEPQQRISLERFLSQQYARLYTLEEQSSGGNASLIDAFAEKFNIVINTAIPTRLDD